jgi:hypothetical protein
MATAKEQLIQLIDHLSAEQLPRALELLKPLAVAQPGTVKIADDNDELQLFLKVLSITLTNTLYDLSTEAERTGSKVLSNRLDFSRKKLFDASQSNRVLNPFQPQCLHHLLPLFLQRIL